jgi:hypothetical protein
MRTLSLLALVLAAGCTCSEPVDERLQPFATANLEPGRGLGDVVLGETTLEEFHARYGQKVVSLIATDETTGFELIYASGQLNFLFPIDQYFARGEFPKLRAAVMDLDRWMDEIPELREAVVSSISVRRARGIGSDFYKGKLDGAVGLGDDIEEAAAKLGGLSEGRSPVVAGMSQANPDTFLVDEQRGIVVYYEEDGAIRRITLYQPEE